MLQQMQTTAKLLNRKNITIHEGAFVLTWVEFCWAFWILDQPRQEFFKIFLHSHLFCYCVAFSIFFHSLLKFYAILNNNLRGMLVHSIISCFTFSLFLVTIGSSPIGFTPLTVLYLGFLFGQISLTKRYIICTWVAKDYGIR